MHKVFILIPVYNRKAITRRCLQMLQKQTYPNREIVVIDDGSTDGTGRMIAEEFPDVTLLTGDGSLWWSGATNKGIAHSMAAAEASDYILTLNDDTVFEPDYLENIMSAAADHPHSLIGSIVVTDQDDPIVIDGGPWINWYTAKVIYANKGRRYRAVLDSGIRMVSVNLLAGRGTLIPVSVVRDIGNMNERRLPHYAADYEFSHRALKNGCSLFVDNRACLKSLQGATGLNNDFKELSWKELGMSFFSRRSSNSVLYRWRFGLLCCSAFLFPTYIVLDLSRTVLRAVRHKLLQAGRRGQS